MYHDISAVNELLQPRDWPVQASMRTSSSVLPYHAGLCPIHYAMARMKVQYNTADWIEESKMMRGGESIEVHAQLPHMKAMRNCSGAMRANRDSRR